MRTRFDDPFLQRLFDTFRAEVDEQFHFTELGPSPWTAPPAALAATRVALVTTAALHLAGDAPFRTATERLGDTGYRIVPRGTPPFALDLDAPYVDRRHVAQDPEVALPLAALEALHRAGLVGEPAPRHVSFSGGIVWPWPALAEPARETAEIFLEDGVGAVVLLPTCPLCVQTVALLARAYEERGLPTVTLTLLPELTRLVGAPRALAVHFPFGAPCGEAGHGAMHQAVLREALALFAQATGPGTLREATLRWRRTMDR